MKKRKYFFVIILVLFFCLPVRAADDVIGVRVYENGGDYTNYPESYINGILTPADWYFANVPNPGNPQSISIDEYPAVQDGRTIYLGGTNLAGGRLRSYIYVISYNEGAQDNTIEIIQRLLETLQLNANINDKLVKGQVQRDLERIMKINNLRIALETYKNKNSIYPKLDAGTYQTGWSYSVWPSWQETLGVKIGTGLPVDPINRFQGCVAPGVDETTCWNAWFDDPSIR